MPAHTPPEDDDIIVREETADGAVVYVLSTAPGSGQYMVRTREEAIAQAVTFAERQGVRAWLSGETDEPILLGEVCLDTRTLERQTTARPRRLEPR